MRILTQNSTASEALAADLAQTIDKHMPGALPVEQLRALEQIDPPLNNMGGTYPLHPYSLPHYEKELLKLVSFETRADISKQQKTKIDWLGFSFPVPGDELSGLAALEYGFQAIWPAVSITPSKTGMRGYGKCHAIMVDGVQVGLIGHGAKHGRDSVSISGVGCATLTHDQWALMYELLQVLDARLSRVDIALDLYRGELTWDHALSAYHREQFKHQKSPVNPEHKIVTSNAGDGSNKGRTLYVGRRESAVMCRVYEKGLEVFARLPEEYREQCTDREAAYNAERGINGQVRTVADDWLRIEVEYKYRDKKIMPFEMLLERDLYFSGAYPYCAFSLGLTDGERPKAMKTNEQISLDKMIRELRRSYGNTVYSLLEVGFTPEDVVQLVSTGVHNQRLVKSGLLKLIQQDEQWKEAKRDQDLDVPF